MDTETLRNIVTDVFRRCDYNRDAAIARLKLMCEYSPSLTIAFAIHGNEVLQALEESRLAVKQ